MYPHDVEAYIVPCMRKMVKAGFPKDATEVANRIVAYNPSVTYLMFEFMSEISRSCEKCRYMDREGAGLRPDLKAVAVIYNRYH